MSTVSRRISLALGCFGLAWCLGWLLRPPPQLVAGPQTHLLEEEERLLSGDHYLVWKGSLMGAGERAADRMLRRWRREGVEGCAHLKGVDLEMRPKVVALRRGRYPRYDYLGSGVLLGGGGLLLTSMTVISNPEDAPPVPGQILDLEISLASGKTIAVIDVIARGEGKATWVILGLKKTARVGGVEAISQTPLQVGEKILALAYHSGMGVPSKAGQGWMMERSASFACISALRQVAAVASDGSIRALAGTDVGDVRGGPMFNDAGELVGLVASMSTQSDEVGKLESRLEVLSLTGLQKALEELR